MRAFLNLIFVAVLALAADTEEPFVEHNHGSMCFSQRIGRRRLLPILPGDCDGLLEAIQGGDKAGAPTHFSRNKTKGFKLPWELHHGTCRIAIDFPQAPGYHLTEDDEDDFTWKEIGQVLAILIKVCVNQPSTTHLGGRLKVGRNGNMILLVVGRERDADDKGRDYYATLPRHGTGPRESRTPSPHFQMWGDQEMIIGQLPSKAELANILMEHANDPILPHLLAHGHRLQVLPPPSVVNQILRSASPEPLRPPPPPPYPPPDLEASSSSSRPPDSRFPSRRSVPSLASVNSVAAPTQIFKERPVWPPEHLLPPPGGFKFPQPELKRGGSLKRDVLKMS